LSADVEDLLLEYWIVATGCCETSASKRGRVVNVAAEDRRGVTAEEE
jgi:hypothetical protein